MKLWLIQNIVSFNEKKILQTSIFLFNIVVIESDSSIIVIFKFSDTIFIIRYFSFNLKLDSLSEYLFLVAKFFFQRTILLKSKNNKKSLDTKSKECIGNSKTFLCNCDIIFIHFCFHSRFALSYWQHLYKWYSFSVFQPSNIPIILPNWYFWGLKTPKGWGFLLFVVVDEAYFICIPNYKRHDFVSRSLCLSTP